MDAALTNFQEAASRDFVLALNGLGIQYMNEGGEKLKEAFDLFRRAAIGGSADGHFNLGK